MTKPALWTSDEIAAATKGRANRTFIATGVSIDSRSIEKGDLFIALVGPKFDGHDFVGQTMKLGAAGAIISHRPATLSADAPAVEVGDTMTALHDLGRAARHRSKARFVAVTGSVGKTSTKEALRTVLQQFGSTFASTGNLNNHWGAPLSLARMDRGAEFGVFELGMNHAGEISPLSNLVQPNVAVITTVEPAHLEFFASVEEIADAKAEIFDGLLPDGVAVLPRDNPHFDRLAARARSKGARMLSFGTHEKADCRLIDCQVTAAGNRIKADILGARHEYEMGVPGRHLAMNSLAVVAAVAALGLDVGRALPAFEKVQAIKGRGQREIVHLSGGAIELIDESYNASPAAMRAALQLMGTLQPAQDGRRIAVLGDMRELGASGADLHRDLAKDVVTAGVDLAFLVGPLMASLYDALPMEKRGAHTADSGAMRDPLLAALKPGDVVLVKGSLGTRMAPLVEAIRELDSKSAPKRAANGH